MRELEDIRQEYKLLELNEATVNPDPFKQFSMWLDDVLNSDNPYPNAMVLSTVSSENRPSSRVVLLKQYSDMGFVFFTNYNSKKGFHLDQQAFASLLFFWPEFQRQVRIEGKVEKISKKESDEYFLKRPLESQVGAWASPQSSIIPNRKTLLDWYEEFDSVFKNTLPKRPPHWGGYRVIPDLFEFWQGRENRLHDRIEYIQENGSWKCQRLAP